MVSLRSGLALILLAGALVRGGDAPGDAILDAWFTAQSRLDSWSAGFTQTRYLKALARPLTNSGHVWFASPNRFRWELGDPVRSVAIRDGNTLVLLSPRLQRAERHDLATVPPGPLREALALLDTGFPRDRSEFERRFEVRSVEPAPDGITLKLVPRDADAVRFLPALSLTLDPATFDLQATEFTLADGSRVHTRFRDPQRNPAPEPDRFDTTVPGGFRLQDSPPTP